MGTPLSHARSSVKKFGGTVELYLPIHTWMDASRAFIGDFRHRYLRHHSGSIADAKRIFGDVLRVSDTTCVSVGAVVREHILEDLGTVPSPTDWFKCINIEPWMMATPTRELESYIKPQGGMDATLAYAEALDKVYDWLNGTDVEGLNGSYRMFRFNSFSIISAREVFGHSIKIGQTEFTTDGLVETLIMYEFGRIPSAFEWANAIRPEVWMGLARDKSDVEGITSMLPTRRGSDKNDNVMSPFSTMG